MIVCLVRVLVMQEFFEQEGFLEAFDYVVGISDANVQLGMRYYYALIDKLCVKKGVWWKQWNCLI